MKPAGSSERRYYSAASNGDGRPPPNRVSPDTARADNAQQSRRSKGPKGAGGEGPTDRIDVPTTRARASNPSAAQKVADPPLQQTMELRRHLDVLKSGRESRDMRTWLVKALMRQFPDLGLELAVRASPRVPKSLFVLSFPSQGDVGTKALNDKTGRMNVDADYTPLRNQAIVKVVRDFEVRHPNAHFAFASEDGFKDLSLVISGVPSETAGEWLGELQQEIGLRVREVTGQYLQRRLAALSEQIGAAKTREDQKGLKSSELTALEGERANVLEMHAKLTDETPPLVYAGVRALGADPSVMQLREAWALAMAGAALNRGGGGARVEGFTPQKMMGALGQFVDVMDAMQSATVSIRGRARALVEPDNETGELVHTSVALRAWRAGQLTAESFSTPEAYLNFRRSLELSNVLDFVYPGTSQELAHEVPKNVERAKRLVELLQSGESFDRWPAQHDPYPGQAIDPADDVDPRRVSSTPIDELEKILTLGPSGERDPRKGLPSEAHYFEAALRRNPDGTVRNRAYLGFDLIGLGINLQKDRTRQMYTLARTAMPRDAGAVPVEITEKDVFAAMVAVNDRAQAYRTKLKNGVEGIVDRLYDVATLRLSSSEHPDDKALAAELKRERGARVSLSGGDERWMDVHFEFARRSDLRALLLAELAAVKFDLDVRVSIARAHVGYAGDRPLPAQVRKTHEEALDALDNGSKRLKQMELEVSELWQRIDSSTRLRTEPRHSPFRAEVGTLMRRLFRFESRQIVADATRHMYLGYDDLRGKEVAYNFDELDSRRLEPLRAKADALGL